MSQFSAVGLRFHAPSSFEIIYFYYWRHCIAVFKIWSGQDEFLSLNSEELVVVWDWKNN